MEVTESTQSMDTSAQTATTTEASTSSVDTSQAVSGSTMSADGQTDAGTQAPASTPYTPSYKFKVMDKEHEIPEFLRPAITSAEHEKQLKELYEKAFGLDEVKAGREKVRGEYQSFKQQVEPVMKTVQEASKLYQGALQAFEQGNVRGGVFKAEEAFKQLGISDKFLQNYVFQKLQLEDLPAHLKADYNRQRELELQYAQMQQQMQEQQTYFQQMAVQTRTAELQQATSRPEVASIIQAFDQRNGPGSFHQEVITRGQMYWQMYQQDVPADQLVQEIINKYGLQAPPAAQPQASTAPKEVPVIPIVKSGSGSPAGRQFKSLDDIKAYRKEQYGS